MRHRVKVGSPRTLSSSLSTVSTYTHAYSLHQDADYPALIPSERSKVVLGREPTSEENSVRGTLVSGLTPEDVSRLDVFEGDVRI